VTNTDLTGTDLTGTDLTGTDLTGTLIGSGPVLLDLDPDGVARLRLNRPEAANGMNVDLLKALHEGIMRCHGEPRVRAVVISGEGPHFCAGGDVRTFASKGEELPAYLREATAWLQICVGALVQLQPPVIAAVHGYAAGGGGFGLVCAADFVVAGESARFMSGAVRVGMAPDAGASVTLTQLVGLRKAMEILLTNPTLTAAQALEFGLLTRVVPDEDVPDEALALARTLSAGAPLALAATKRLVWRGTGASLESQLPEEARTVCELSGTADAREGLAAVLERRAPVFRGE
jgi:2-(1,2-epoxy-1,2-dihydrophenyl)acetyl-CoA isomerase